MGICIELEQVQKTCVTHCFTKQVLQTICRILSNGNKKFLYVKEVQMSTAQFKIQMKLQKNKKIYSFSKMHFTRPIFSLFFLLSILHIQVTFSQLQAKYDVECPFLTDREYSDRMQRGRCPFRLPTNET